MMMRLYAEGGSRQKAHRQYESFRDALRRDIGAAPSEETEALIRDILAGKFDHAPDRLRSLIGRLTMFFLSTLLCW